MYELTIKGHFDAAHYLREYPGKCSQIHGHTWEIEVVVGGTELDNLGMLIDFSVLKENLKEVLAQFDHRLINELPGFAQGQLNPTAENLAKYIYLQMQPRIVMSTSPNNNKIQLIQVRVWESPRACACYKED
ncbi:MAG: 6-carboxytetrahydropterin synthase QueD [Carboxydocellales bacterium]